MTNTQTMKANHYFRALVALAVLTMTASLLAVMAVRPASASTTFTVNLPFDTSDATSADGLCDVATFIPGEQCTLRAAIQQANATQGADAIHFDIPDSYGAGVKTIHVGGSSPSNGELPTITDTVTIDGYTQPGSSENTLSKGTNAKLMIQLEGSSLGPLNSVGLYPIVPNVAIRGLVINRFSNGIEVGSNADTRIEGNFIGPYPSGTKAPGSSGTGVTINGGARVGGPEPAARNLISGNGGCGVLLSFASHGNEVSGNLIGTQRDGKSPLGNGFDGVFINSQAPHNEVGKAEPGYANTIAFNEGDGVRVFNSVGTSLLSNSIHSNGGLGIDLMGPGESFDTNVPTPNDPGDADTGPNNLQNKPVLSSAKTASGKTTIKGTLSSNTDRTYTIELYSNPADTNEGKKFIGETTVRTSIDGLRSFTFSPSTKVPAGQTITATATNKSTGDTSEFSAPRKVVAS